MRYYFRWLLYYLLNFISSIVNFFLAFFFLGGKCKIEEDFLFRSLDKELSKQIQAEQELAEKNLQEVKNKIQESDRGKSI